MNRETLRKMRDAELWATIARTGKALKSATGHERTALAAQLSALESESNRRDKVQEAA